MLIPKGIGVGVPHQWINQIDNVINITKETIPNMKWWHSWLYHHCDDPMFFPTWWGPELVSERQILNFENILEVIKLFPDKFWLLGNEPEFSGQANITPQNFKEAVDTFRNKTNVPFALPGIALGFYGYRWLKEYIEIGGYVGDYIHVHIYATTIKNYNDNYNELQDILKQYNLSAKIIVTETSAAHMGLGFQKNIVKANHTAIRTNKIEAFAWFSAQYSIAQTFQPEPYWANSDLMEYDGKVTKIGRYFREYKIENELYIPTIRKDK